MSSVALLNENAHKPWLNPRVNNLTVDGASTISNINILDLTVTNDTMLNNLSVNGFYDIDNLSVNDNCSTDNLIVSNDTTLNNLLVNNTCTINDLSINNTLLSPSINFGQTNLNYYEFTTISGNFSGPWASPILTNFVFIKIGRTVNLTISGNNYSTLASITSLATSSFDIPTRFLPSTIGNSLSGYTPVVDNGTPTVGHWLIDVTTARISIGVGLIISPFTGLSTIGGTGWDTFTITYLSLS